MAGKREKPEDIVLKLRQFKGCAGCHSLSISDIPKVLWRGIYRQEGAGVDRGRGRENCIHHTRLTLGKWLRRKRQRPRSGLVAQRRGLHHVARGSNSDRTMAGPLQCGQATQRFGLPPANAKKHRPDGPKAGHALTFKPDHPIGAHQGHCDNSDDQIGMPHATAPGSAPQNVVRPLCYNPAPTALTRCQADHGGYLAFYDNRAQVGRLTAEVSSRISPSAGGCHVKEYRTAPPRADGPNPTMVRLAASSSADDHGHCVDRATRP
jgi:hypothetical protein